MAYTAEQRSAYGKAWRRRQPPATEADRIKKAVARRHYLLKEHGISAEQYEAMLVAQHGGCAFCQAKPAKQHLDIDHDHACCPGKFSCGRCVRWLLCSRCNRMLGCARDNIHILLTAAQKLSAKGFTQ